MKKHRITSWKSSFQIGAKNALLTFGTLIVFVCFVHYVMLQGEEFIGKNETLERIGVFSFSDIKMAGAIISAIIPVIFLRYSHIKYLLVYVPCGIALYYLLYIFTLLFGETISFGLLYPLETFDGLHYALDSFPAGSVIGTVISMAVNEILRFKNSR